MDAAALRRSATHFRASRMATLRAARQRAAGAPPRPSPSMLAQKARLAARAARQAGAARMRRALSTRCHLLAWSEVGVRFGVAKLVGANCNKPQLESLLRGPRARVPTCTDIVASGARARMASVAAVMAAAGLAGESAAPRIGGANPYFVDLVAQAVRDEEARGGVRLLRDAPEPALASLKEAFPDAELRDLARFVIACKGDAAKAAKRWRVHQTWREEELPRIVRGAPTRDYALLDQAAVPEGVIAELQTGKMVLRGRDRAGRPMMIWDNGAHNPATSKPGQVLPMVVYLMESITADMGNDQHQINMLVYCPSNSKFDLGLIKGAARLFAEQYPERLGKVLVFPVNSWKRWLWSVAKPFLPARTRDKVALLDSNNWQETIVDYIDEAELQERFGGRDSWKFEECWERARGPCPPRWRAAKEGD